MPADRGLHVRGIDAREEPRSARKMVCRMIETSDLRYSYAAGCRVEGPSPLNRRAQKIVPPSIEGLSRPADRTPCET